MMKRKKLNETQRKALALMAENTTVDFYDLAKIGIQGATTNFLVSHGLAKKTKSQGCSEWAITPEGKAAAQAGYFEVSTPPAT